MAVKFVLGLLVIFILITFAVKNQQDVVVSYYFGYGADVKLWVAILVSFALGAGLAVIGAGFSLLREKSRNWSLSRKLSKLEDEISEMKQKPLPDEPDIYPAQGAAAKPQLAGREMKSLPAKAGVSPLQTD